MQRTAGVQEYVERLLISNRGSNDDLYLRIDTKKISKRGQQRSHVGSIVGLTYSVSASPEVEMSCSFLVLLLYPLLAQAAIDWAPPNFDG